MNEEKVLWTPSQSQIDQSNLAAFMKSVNLHYHLNISTYEDLWKWSIEKDVEFWTYLFSYFNIIFQGELTPYQSGESMIDKRWFQNISLNYAENLMKDKQDEDIAIIESKEGQEIGQKSWIQLKTDVAAVQKYLIDNDCKVGDCVCGVLENSYETSVLFLASAALGLIWSCSAPEFGTESIVDRFQQIKPKAFFFVDSYIYNNKKYDISDKISAIRSKLPSIQLEIDCSNEIKNEKANHFGELIKNKGELRFERLNFNAPLWVLYSSGTTGKPKAITHSHGGILLEHFKYHAFHCDVKPHEVYFWYSTTGWMMWNFLHGAWLQNATIVLYNGSPSYPTLDNLWALIEKVKINHFGTSAPFILACMKADLKPKESFDLSSCRSIGSTGSPLPSECFDWIYSEINSNIWLASMSGGTDVCTAFVGGNPIKPVYKGEIQSKALACSLFVWDESRNELLNEPGEMVITKAMPSMPIYFWGDEGNVRYLESYYAEYEKVWRHGDWIKETAHQGIIIYGRSDTTLNRNGIRIGTSEIYRCVDQISSIQDSIIVNIELENGLHFMPLFVMMKPGYLLTDETKSVISQILIKQASNRHVPDKIIEVADLPYTLSGKKMENIVKKILSNRTFDAQATKDTMKNPQSLDFFIAWKLENSLE